MVSSSAKAENEINERGYFWWSDETIPEGAIAPSGRVNGLLTITNNGRTTINLDGILSTEKSMLFDPGRPTNRNISGILLSDSRSVLLCDPHNNGVRIGKISHENFSAKYCLISPETLIDVKDRRSFYGMGIDLSNFQDWIRKSSITAKRKNKSTTIKYKQKKRLIFKIKDGTFEIKFCLGDGSSLHGDKVLLRESTHMVCKSKYTTLES